MYCRLVVDKSGKVFLEQLLTFSETINGKVTPAKPKWEVVPTLVQGGKVTTETPLSMACGIFRIAQKITRFQGEHNLEYHCVSSLDVALIRATDDGMTYFENHAKKSFLLNIPLQKFIELHVRLLNRFSVLTIGVDGNITEGDFYVSEEKKQ